MSRRTRILAVLALGLVALTYLPLRGWDSEPYGLVREEGSWTQRGNRRSGLKLQLAGTTATTGSTVTTHHGQALGVKNIWFLGLADHPLVHELCSRLVEELRVLPYLDEVGFFPAPMQPLDVRRVPDLWITVDLVRFESTPLPLYHRAKAHVRIRVERTLADQQGPLDAGTGLAADLTWRGRSVGLLSEASRWMPAAESMVEQLHLADKIDALHVQSGRPTAPPLTEWTTATSPPSDLTEELEEVGRLVWSGRRAWTSGEALWHFQDSVPEEELASRLTRLGFTRERRMSPGDVRWIRGEQEVHFEIEDATEERAFLDRRGPFEALTEETALSADPPAPQEPEPERFVTREVEFQERLGSDAEQSWTRRDPLAERAFVGLSRWGVASVVRRDLGAAIEEGTFPGAAAIWGSLGETHGAVRGKLSSEKASSDVARAHLYDLASLTKVVSTTTLALLLEQEGSWSLNDPLEEHLPTFVGEDPRRGEVRLHHLLRHTSGLPAWMPLHREHAGLEAIVAAASEAPLERAPGEERVYSDLGLILLGAALEHRTGRRLADLERERIFEPLGMVTATREPTAPELPACAPTEARADGSGYWQGIVHDENARAAEGGTGHAGLFASAVDLALFAREWLKAARGEGRILTRATVERVRDLEGAPWLGWRGVEGREDVLHHTGFTGTALWIDLQRSRYAILLTNRVHPTREGSGIGEVRQRFFEAVMPE